MSKVRYQGKTVSELERRALELAIRTVEKIEHGELLALMCQDDVGVFFHFRPNAEVPVVQYLSELDWNHIRRTVEEHIE